MTASRWTVLAAAVLCPGDSDRHRRHSDPNKAPGDKATRATRQRFLEMFARAYFPGRTGQLLVVPRKGGLHHASDPYYAQIARHALAL